MLRVVAVLALIGAPSSVHAAEPRECTVRLLRPVTDDLGNRWATGKLLPVTILRQDKDGGSFCAHGGSCIPRNVNGRVAVRLIDCRIGTAIGHGDYRLVAASVKRQKPAH